MLLALPEITNLDKILLDNAYSGNLEAMMTDISASAKAQEILCNIRKEG